MTLKELKDCISQIPEEFDDAEVKFEERRASARYLHDIKKMSYGEYESHEKFVRIKERL